MFQISQKQIEQMKKHLQKYVKFLNNCDFKLKFLNQNEQYSHVLFSTEYRSKLHFHKIRKQTRIRKLQNSMNIMNFIELFDQKKTMSLTFILKHDLQLMILSLFEDQNNSVKWQLFMKDRKRDQKTTEHKCKTSKTSQNKKEKSETKKNNEN